MKHYTICFLDFFYLGLAGFGTCCKHKHTHTHTHTHTHKKIMDI